MPTLVIQNVPVSVNYILPASSDPLLDASTDIYKGWKMCPYNLGSYLLIYLYRLKFIISIPLLAELKNAFVCAKEIKKKSNCQSAKLN